MAKRPETLEARMFHALVSPLDRADDEIAGDLQHTLIFGRGTLLFGAVSVMVLICALAFLENAGLAALLGLVLLAATGMRYFAITRKDADADTRLRHVVYSGIFYALVIGLVGASAAISHNPALLVLGGLVMTGLAFGFCMANSGTPHFARLQTLLVVLPFLFGAGLSGPPEMLLVLVQAPFWIVGIFMLVRLSHGRLASLIRAQRQNRYLAYNDSLTGLANRAQVMSSLRQIAQDRAGRSPPPYLLYLDLDGFKAVNDTYGHAVGDLLLRQVAQRLSAEMRAGDILGRIGGDEFVIILRELDPKHIGALAQRLAAAIARPFALTPSIEVTIGVSIGGAPLGRNAEDSMAEADTRLYAAKRDGRGTYRLAGL